MTDAIAAINPSRAADAGADVLLSVRNVSQRLGGVQILKDLSFEVQDRVRPGATTGQVVALLGPSGVGKTRLLRILAALDAPDSGEVVGHKGKRFVPGEVGVVFQNYPILKHRTVESNLTIAGTSNGLSHATARDRARDLLGRFGLLERARYFPSELSGGQRQRVAIAQQLVSPKTYLLMDEPFSGLDPQALGEVIRLVVEVAHMHEHNTIILVTHDIWAAMVVADTILMLGRERTPDGKIIPGAAIRATHDLVARGLAWRDDVEHSPAFLDLEREVRHHFKIL